jgi:hypothetical protein
MLFVVYFKESVLSFKNETVNDRKKNLQEKLESEVNEYNMIAGFNYLIICNILTDNIDSKRVMTILREKKILEGYFFVYVFLYSFSVFHSLLFHFIFFYILIY